MNQFSISQLENYSGIKAHTIRIWEKRYGALTPNRSEGNTRYYDGDQLRRLLNIVSLSGNKYKVSELCGMPDKKLFKLLCDQKNDNENKKDEYFVSQLIAAAISYDEYQFDKIFSYCLLRYGLKDMYLKLLYPVLSRTGLMWACDELPTANEHFISNLIRQKLVTAIDSLPPSKNNQDSWLLFLPENEFHEIGLLLSHYLILLSGRKVIYLGSNMPVQSVIESAEQLSCKNLLFFLVHRNSEEEIQKYLSNISIYFKEKNIYAVGDKALFSQLNKEKNTLFLSSVDDLEQQLC